MSEQGEVVSEQGEVVSEGEGRWRVRERGVSRGGGE